MTRSLERDEIRERNQSLMLLTVSPLVWAAHFLLSYVTAAIYCAKLVGEGHSLYWVRIAIAVLTIAALAAIAVVGRIGYKRHSFGRETIPHDEDTPEDRHRFLGLATVLLSALSAVATLYVALAAVFIGTCY